MNNFINVRLEAYNHNKTLNAIKHNIRHIQSKSERLNFDNMSKDLEHNKNNYFIFYIFNIRIKNKDMVIDKKGRKSIFIGVGAFFWKFITKYTFWLINSVFRSFIYILFKKNVI